MKKKTFLAKVFLFIAEYFIRILGAVIVSITLIILSIMPFPNSTKLFFKTLELYTNMQRLREEANGNRAMEKTDGN